MKREQKSDGGENQVLAGVVELLIQLRKDAKPNKDWATADKIRDELNALGIELMDTKDGFEWNLRPS